MPYYVITTKSGKQVESRLDKSLNEVMQEIGSQDWIELSTITDGQASETAIMTDSIEAVERI